MISNSHISSLLAQGGPSESGFLPDLAELATNVLKTVSPPGVAEHWAGLVPEIYRYSAHAVGEILMAGRVGAGVIAQGRPPDVFDSKCYVAPTAADRRKHAGPLLQYMETVDASRGAVVNRMVIRAGVVSMCRRSLSRLETTIEIWTSTCKRSGTIDQSDIDRIIGGRGETGRALDADRLTNLQSESYCGNLVFERQY